MLEVRINLVKSTKDWRYIVKKIRNSEPQLIPGIEAHKFRQYFVELLNPSQSSRDIHYAPMQFYDEYLDRPIEENEITAVLVANKNNKAPGEDRICYEFLKNGTEILREIQKSFNIIFETAKLENKFIKSVIFPIFKKGDRNIPNNYRVI